MDASFFTVVFPVKALPVPVGFFYHQVAAIIYGHYLVHGIGNADQVACLIITIAYQYLFYFMMPELYLFNTVLFIELKKQLPAGGIRYGCKIPTGIMQLNAATAVILYK